MLFRSFVGFHLNFHREHFIDIVQCETELGEILEHTYRVTNYNGIISIQYFFEHPNVRKNYVFKIVSTIRIQSLRKILTILIFYRW